MQEKRKKIGDILFLLFLMIYPMRHIHWGLDLWDTGYNYANFQYMGLDHMDSMWLFSTYLANAVGNFMTKLPFGGTLIGMNFYTGLTVSLLAVMGYLFCTKSLKIPSWIAFLGEFVAISLCWCPTALLYNYLTYILFLGCFIFLYYGLTKEKMWYLFMAGIFLGINVLVRFSNLPEAAMIVGVWAYAILVGLEKKGITGIGFAKNNTLEGQKLHLQQKKQGKVQEKKQQSAQNRQGTIFSIAVRYTLWCLGGYLTALFVLFGYIHIRYGLDNFIAGIQRLFAMTDNATDYKATSMLMGIVYTYLENLYWVVRMVFILAVGMVFYVIANGIAKKWGVLKEKRMENTLVVFLSRVVGVVLIALTIYWFYKGGFCSVSLKNLPSVLYMIVLFLLLAVWYRAKLFSAVLAVSTIQWLYLRAFCNMNWNEYGSMLRPSILFMMLAMFIGVVNIFRKNCPKEEKLVNGMIVLVILLTSIGSNNGVYPSINNLFITAPYIFWQVFCFVTQAKDITWKKIEISIVPVKAMILAFAAMFAFQGIGFGTGFVFVEAAGAKDVVAKVENNKVLKGVKMSPERAKWMEEITAYVEQEGLQGKEVILYGQLPALSFYLQMPSAFNPWSDLRSYSLETMKKDMAELCQAIEEQAEERPVVIVENDYMRYQNEGIEALEEAGVSQKQLETIQNDKKWELLVEFLENYQYKVTFSNEKFTVWE